MSSPSPSNRSHLSTSKGTAMTSRSSATTRTRTHAPSLAAPPPARPPASVGLTDSPALTRRRETASVDITSIELAKRVRAHGHRVSDQDLETWLHELLSRGLVDRHDDRWRLSATAMI